MSDRRTAITGPRPLVWFIPEDRGRMVTMHACWGADFGGETAVFPTKQEAIDFCERYWKRTPRVQEPAIGNGSPGDPA